MADVATSTRTCARCGRRLAPGRRVFSSVSGRYFCPPREWGRCLRLAAKGKA